MFHNGGTQDDNMQAVLHVKHENLLRFQSSLHDRNQSQLRLILIVTKERGKQSYKLFTGSHHAHSNSTCTLTLNLSLLPFTSLSVHIHPYPFSSQPRYSSSISIKTYSIKNSKESKGMFTFTLVPILSSRLVLPPYHQEYSPISTRPIFITISLVLSYKETQGIVLELSTHTCSHSPFTLVPILCSRLVNPPYCQEYIFQQQSIRK